MMKLSLMYLFPLLLLLAAPAVYADELHISSSGEIQAIGQIVGKNALNLLTLNVWGYKFKVFIEHGVRVEDLGGKPIKLEEVLEGHTVEVKGKTFIGRSDTLEPAYMRDFSVGKKEDTPAPAVPIVSAKEQSTSGNKESLTKDLSLGMRGKEITVLQEFLQKNNWGIPNDGPVTGHFGKVTKKALMNFQKAQGLAAVGIAGPETRRLINLLLSK